MSTPREKISQALQSDSNLTPSSGGSSGGGTPDGTPPVTIIVSPELTDGSINTIKLADGAVTMGKLNADVITALDGKSATTHTHAFSEITGKPTTLAGYGITDGASHNHPIGNITGLQAALDAKASLSTATQGSNGLFSAADKTKLDGVAAGANNYVHPDAHPATIITEDETHRFVTDSEKTIWNSGSGGGSSKMQVVAKKNQATFGSSDTYSGSKGGYTYCQRIIFACDCYDVQFLFINPIEAVGNAITLKVSLETTNGDGGDSTFYPLSSNGVRLFTVQPDEYVWTDQFPQAFKKDDIIYLRIFVTSTSNIHPIGVDLSAGYAGEGRLDGDYTNFPTSPTERSNNFSYTINGVDRITGTPNHQNSWGQPGLGAVFASDANGYCAALCVGKLSAGVAAVPVVALIGDSISRGTGADNSFVYGIGYGFMQMAVDNADGAWINLGLNGESASGFLDVGGFSRWVFLDFCTHAMVEYGVNDVSISGAASNEKITTITSNLQKIYSICKEHGIGKVYACTPVVKTDSTDTWATIGNQTAGGQGPNGFIPRANGGNNTWQDLVSWLQGNSVSPVGSPIIPAPINLDGCFNTQLAVVTLNASNVPVWSVGMVYQDSLGVHPNGAGHVAMSAFIPASSFTITSPVVGGGSGSVGAKPTYVNIKDFGAVGDGIANDTAAFVSALAALGTRSGGILFFPEGNYILRQRITLNRVILKGAGNSTTQIIVDTPLGTGVAVIYMFHGGVGLDTGLEDISLNCTVNSKVLGSRNHGVDGVEMGRQAFLNRVYINNFDVGLNINGASHSSITGTKIDNCYYNVYFQNDEGDHTFFDSNFTGAAFASIAVNGDKGGHPQTFFLRCHVGFCPFGIYQTVATTPAVEISFMDEWVLDCMRFESIGNAAIYSESWATANGRGLVDCVFKGTGFGWWIDPGVNTLASYPSDKAVVVGWCKGTIIYEPGMYPFLSPDFAPKGIKIQLNSARWIGSFQYDDFDIQNGWYALFPHAPNKIQQAGRTNGNLIMNVITENAMADNENPFRTITIILADYANSGAADVLQLPFPLDRAPMIAKNFSTLPDAAITADTVTISITPGNATVYSGMITLFGY